MTDLIVPEGVQEAGDEPAAEGFVPAEVPCEFHLLNGKTFIVEKVGGWCHMEQGVFATGHFKGYSGESDVLIPYDRIDYYEFDFPRLKKYYQEQQANANPGT